MNAIVDILMRRDNMTREEAERELNIAREEFDPVTDEIDDFLAEHFGLEPDYLFDFLE